MLAVAAAAALPGLPSPLPLTLAWVEFHGFRLPGAAHPEGFTLLLERGGEPRAVAAWLAVALRQSAGPADFAAACLAVEGIAWRPYPGGLRAGGPPGGSPVAPLCTYRYRLVRGRKGRSTPLLQCWRRYRQPIGWQRRCGPLPLGHFLRHFAAHPLPAWGTHSSPAVRGAGRRPLPARCG